MYGPNNKFEDVSLSRQTVTRGIVVMADVSKKQLKSEAEKFEYFSLALDECTDISDASQLLMFVLGVYNDLQLHRNWWECG